MPVRLKAVKADLAELNVSKVDLVLLHKPCKSDGTNAKLWQGLEQALAQNLTRAIGVSNFNKDQLGALLKVATTKPAVNQCQMSMANQEDEMLAYCAEQGIVFEATLRAPFPTRGCRRSPKRTEVGARWPGLPAGAAARPWMAAASEATRRACPSMPTRTSTCTASS